MGPVEASMSKPILLDTDVLPGFPRGHGKAVAMVDATVRAAEHAYGPR